MIYDDTTPIAALSVADFKSLVQEIQDERKTRGDKPAQTTGRRFVYGLKGIQSLFHCSHLTAQRYKDTFLAPAVMQQGRKIVIDADHAVELFKAYRDGND